MGEKGKKNRDHIIDTANRLFYQRGYNQTSFSDIADAAGIPRGNFYYYFKTKDDILLAVIGQRIERIRAMLAAWDREPTEPRQRLKRFVQMLRNERADLARYGCPMGSLNMELGKNQPHLKRKAREMFDLFRDWLTVQFTELGCTTDAHQLALRLLADAQGIVVISHVYADRGLLAQETARLDTWIDALSKQA